MTITVMMIYHMIALMEKEISVSRRNKSTPVDDSPDDYTQAYRPIPRIRNDYFHRQNFHAWFSLIDGLLHTSYILYLYQF